MYGTRRMRWRANSRQMTRPSRRGAAQRGDDERVAFGAYGEASPDVHALLTVAADGLAARHSGATWARTQQRYIERRSASQWGF